MDVVLSISGDEAGHSSTSLPADKVMTKSQRLGFESMQRVRRERRVKQVLFAALKLASIFGLPAILATRNLCVLSKIINIYTGAHLPVTRFCMHMKSN